VSEIVRLGTRLLIITFVAALALSITNMVTAGPIEVQIQNENDMSRQAVLPEAETFELMDDMKDIDLADWPDIKEVYTGKSGDRVVGYTFKISVKGYGGSIEMTLGIDTEGKISGLKIGNHQETPGLGAKAAESSFQDQYKGKNAEGELTVTKASNSGNNEVEAITGATITTRAITDGVNNACRLYLEIVEQ
jgi:electron transport complex protein RnfG